MSERVNALQRARYWRDKQRELARIEKRLAEEVMSLEVRDFLEKRVTKLRKALENHHTVSA